MELTNEQQRVRDLLTETVTLLCKNGLHFNCQLGIEGLIGITIDKEEVFLVSIKEILHSETNALHDSQENISDTNNMTDDLEMTAGDKISPSERNSEDVQCLSHLQGRERRTQKNSKKESANAVSTRNGIPVKSEPVDEVSDEPDYEPQSKCPKSERHCQKNWSEFMMEDNFSISLSHRTEFNTTLASNETASYDDKFESQTGHTSYAVDIKEENTENEGNSFVAIGSLCANSLDDLKTWNQDREQEMLERFNDEAMSDDQLIQYGSAPFIDPRTEKSRKRQSFALRRMTDVGAADNNEAHRCPICGTVSLNWNLYLHHIRKHQPGMYRCPFCGKSFSGSTNLRGHLALHTNVKEFACHLCKKAYAYKKDLSEHLILKHGIGQL